MTDSLRQSPFDYMMNGMDEGEEIGLKYLSDYNMEVMFIESLVTGVVLPNSF